MLVIELLTRHFSVMLSSVCVIVKRLVQLVLNHRLIHYHRLVLLSKEASKFSIHRLQRCRVIDWWFTTLRNPCLRTCLIFSGGHRSVLSTSSHSIVKVLLPLLSWLLLGGSLMMVLNELLEKLVLVWRNEVSLRLSHFVWFSGFLSIIWRAIYCVDGRLLS